MTRKSSTAALMGLTAAAALLAGCGSTPTRVAKNSATTSTPSVPPTQRSSTHVLTAAGLSIRVPDSWQLGRQVIIQATSLTASRAPNLLPIVPPSEASPASPFFSKQHGTTGGMSYGQLTEITAKGQYLTLQIQVPARDAASLKTAMGSVKSPPVVSASKDLRLIETTDTDHMLSYQAARVGSRDRWVLVGGNPATAQEEFALYRSTDGGKSWSLPVYTTFRGNHVFLGLAGMTSLKFWNPHDGIIAESSGFAQTLVILYTTNGGETWHNASVPKLGAPTGDSPPTIRESASGTLTVSATYPHRLRTVQSTDGGKEWSISAM